MSSNVFINWFEKSKKFLNKASASTHWDQKIADPTIQKAIAQSNTGQVLYAYIESKIAHDHAKLFDSKLREAFAKLNRADFVDPSGFAEIKKASVQVRNFIDVRNRLAFFVKDDINQHHSRDSQLNAFRRWLTTAECLLKRNCYEGYFLVTTVLLEIDIVDKFSRELPKACQDNFARLCDLADPSSNFSALRSEIARKKSPNDFVPVFLRSRDLTSLNTALGENESEIGPNDPLYTSLELKERMLQEIMEEQQGETPHLSKHILTTYKRSGKKYSSNLATVGIEKATTPKGPEGVETSAIPKPTTVEPSKLYTSGLLPAFWKRNCSEKQHWEKMFCFSEGPTP